MIMRKTLRSGAHQFEILNPNESVLTFRDIPSAIAFLNRFKNDRTQMAILREIVLAHSNQIVPRDADEVIRQFATLLIGGRLSVLRVYEFAQGSGGEGAAQPQPPGGPPGPTPAKKSWIEIYLFTSDGKPVAGEKYRIKMPDGSVEEGKLDPFGHAEYYGINPGTCEVSFPDRDAIEWGPA
jgi:hypothetical protein